MIWVDILMTTLLFLVALHLWNLSVTNLKSISILQVSFLSWNQFCYSSLLGEFRISHFGSFLWLMLQFLSTIGISLIVLNHTCPLSLMTLKILLCWKFSDGIWRWQNWLSSAAVTHLQNYLRCQGSTLPPYSYGFPERFVRQRVLHFYPSAGGILSWWSGRLLDLRDPYLCNCLTYFLRSKLSRPVIVHCHGHLPICPIWACPWTKNLSNLAQIGSRLCGKQISGTAGWI